MMKKEYTSLILMEKSCNGNVLKSYSEIKDLRGFYCFFREEKQQRQQDEEDVDNGKQTSG